MENVIYAGTLAADDLNEDSYILILNCKNQDEAREKMEKAYGNDWHAIYTYDLPIERDFERFRLKRLKTLE